jgi:hypothetical protein
VVSKATLAAAMLRIEMSSTKQCGAITTTPATGCPAPACSSAIEAPSEWPTSTGFSISSAASSCGSVSRPSMCM